MGNELVIHGGHFNPETVGRVLECAENNMSLKEIASEDGMPKVGTIKRWIRDNEDFRVAFFTAVQTSLALDAPDILKIADGDDKPDELTARSKLRIETRLKLHQEMSRMLSATSGGPKSGRKNDPNVVMNIRDKIAQDNAGLPPGAREIDSTMDFT